MRSEALLALASLIVLGCTNRVDGSEAASLSEQRKPLFMPPNSACHPGEKRLTTCWDPVTFGGLSAAQQQRMKDVEAWVREGIGMKADVDFVGWKTCPSNSNGYVWMGFNPADGASHGGCGVWFGTGIINNSNAADARGQTLHEFMHVLGFGHEVDRSDQPASDQNPANKPQGACGWKGAALGGTAFTPYDPSSILNYTYCGSAMNVLSPWDIVGLQKVFGRKRQGSTLTQHNQCMDLDNGAFPTPPAQATRIQTWDCIGNENQRWVLGSQLGPAGHVGQAFLDSAYLSPWVYLDAQWGGSSNGTPLWNWQFNGGDAQLWTFRDAAIVGMGDLCLEVPGGNYFAGATLQVDTCDGRATQRWNLKPSSSNGARVQLEQNGWCVVRSGAGVSLHGCAAFETTYWTLDNGRIMSDFAGSSCLDVNWASPAPGNGVGLLGCRSNSDDLRFAQRWRLRTTIRNGASSMCVDADNSSAGPKPGSTVQLWQCNGGLNQTWEHWF